MAEKGSGKLLTLTDWEQLFHDFRASLALQHKWLAAWPGLTILDQALQSLTKKDFPLKPPLLIFLEENAPALFEDNTPSAMSMLIDSLKSLLNTPVDGTAITFSLKEQILITTTAIAIDVNAIHTATAHFEALVETLLGFISRTNSAIDRQVRGAACECLKALEMAHPCLLHLCVGHVFAFCQSERTHVSQAYKLLFLAVLHNMACWMYSGRGRGVGGGAFLTITVPVVPFSVPGFLVGEGAAVPARELNAGSVKEFKRAVAYLLQHLDLFTEFGMLEFTTRFLNIAKALDLHGSLLRPTVASHLYVYNPVMIHAVLIIITHFPKAFEGEDHSTVKRLATLCRESQQPLPIRLLGLHWLLGLENHHVKIEAAGLYPRMYDPLALQALKLAALAHLEATASEQGAGGIFQVLEIRAAPADAASQILNEGLLCLSSFTWLPRSSTETRIAFFVLHRFLTSQATTPALLATVQLILVRMAVRILSLIPSILQLLDQLLACEAHRGLGERLLRTFDEDLLPQLAPSRNLPAYFPLLERIAENASIPPGRLLELLTLYVRKRVEEDKGDGGLRLWQRGNQVLGICCKVLTHHQSSRGFHGLVPLLTFMCRFFSDLDCRDTARLYLRMLISIPGEPLRKILRHEDKRIKEASAASQYDAVSSDPNAQATKQLEVPEYVKLTRETTLLVRHSWSLVLYNTFQTPDSPEVVVEEISDQEETKNTTTTTAITKTLQVTTPNAPKEKKGEHHAELPRVMDARTATILGVLRQHFEEIPGSGVKITVRCRLRFLGQSLSSSDSWPSIYAVVVAFLTTGLYGPIPSAHVPFLLSEAPRAPGASSPTSVINVRSKSCPDQDSDDENQVVLLEGDPCGETVVVELEPKQPVPTLVDAHIVFSDEEGRTVQGQLDSIPVGIEDLFQKPPLPATLPPSSRPEYLLALFKALFAACSGPGHLGGETFPLKNAPGVSIQGSESVKLLEGQADRIVGAVEQWLGPFVVAVTGSALVAMVTLKHPAFPEEDESGLQPERSGSSSPSLLRLEDSSSVRGRESSLRAVGEAGKGGVGCFFVLIFLPPRFHLLLRMEVSDWSTLVRIRTDHWPCLAHVDEFLEALVMSR